MAQNNSKTELNSARISGSLAREACLLPKGYTPLPGFKGKSPFKDGKNPELEKFFTLEPGKCIVCGGVLPEAAENIVCGGLCLEALTATGGYLEPDVEGLKRCPKCGIRMLSSLRREAHCGHVWRPVGKGEGGNASG